MDFSVLTDNWPQILNGLVLTLKLWLGGTLSGLALGLLLATIQVNSIGVVWHAIRGYSAVFRGVPLLIQLFLLYYGGPSIGFVLSPVAAGLLGLTIYSSAQFVEIFRAGFESVPRGQIEAARISGLNRFQILVHIELPQMLIIIVPSLVNLFVIMTKETAILSVISIPDLTAVLNGIGSTTYAFAETLFALAAFYWILLECVTMAGRVLERRASRYLIR
ncbi:amino acid ABC transporter membrane protein 2 (PAAT family) [Mesorhizobium sp. J18]|uniref:amino acid ABC transporter permease n=1 Tax=Mesorhizobium sp. J18 TaxID=935263 RepID=UPI00119B6AD3|nr:amino acid ABC transporter permease [Mesorhizobium sp. J18]TWG92357.1 amino acid ABC transporter membrane protein 2 (PAAT family) [Mesorhizobium sp. J18]